MCLHGLETKKNGIRQHRCENLTYTVCPQAQLKYHSFNVHAYEYCVLLPYHMEALTFIL
jgi:hypothetical protein